MKTHKYQTFTTPNQLTLVSSTIQNVLYDMYSLIALGQYGGIVNITSSYFNRVSICGSIIKNQFTFYNYSDYNSINSSTPNDLQYKLMNDYNRDQLYYYLSKNLPTSSPFTCTTSCFGIVIKSSTFSNFHYEKPLLTVPVMVNQDLGMQYQGYILTLSSFNGDIYILDSTFSTNYIMYDGGCTIQDYLINYQNEVDTSLSQFYGAFSVYQLKTLISIQKHSNLLVFQGNDFNNNVMLKGIIMVEITEQKVNPLIFKSNSFSQNTGYFMSNVLYLRKLQTNVLTSYPSPPICGGIKISSNSFSNNVGCYKQTLHGAVYSYCGEAGTITSYTQYNSFYCIPSLDSCQLTDYSTTTAEQTTLLDLGGSTFFKTTSYVKIDLNGVSELVDMTSFELYSNNYTQNFASIQSSIVQSELFPKVNITNENYLQNGNSFPDAIQSFSQMYSEVMSNQTDLSQYSFSGLTITDDYLESEWPFKAQSIIKITRAIYLEITSCIFKENWIIDSGLELDSSQYNSHSLLLSFLYGNFSIKSSTFISQSGIYNDMTTNLFPGVFSNVAQGMRKQLLTFQNPIFSSFKITQSTFESLEFYSSSNDFPITIFSYPSSSYQLQLAGKYSATISSCTFQSITMYNCDMLIDVYHPQMYLTSNTFQLIGGSYTGVSGPTNLLYLNIETTSNYTLTSNYFASNYIPNGATIALQQSEAGLQYSSDPGTDVTLTIDSCTFEKNNSTVTVSLDGNKWIVALIKSSYFSQNLGVDVNELYIGPGLYYLSMYSVQFKELEPSSPTKATAIYKQGSSTLYMERVQINCLYASSGFSDAETTYIIQTKKVADAIASPIYFSGGTITMIQNSYYECYAALNGGVIYADSSSNITDTDSSYSLNSAINGGLFFLKDNSTLNLTNVNMLENSASSGSIAVIEEYSSLYINSNSLIQNNQAYYFATIYALANSYFMINDTVFSTNNANLHSVIIYAISPLSGNVMAGCTFIQNTVTSGYNIMTLLFVDLTIIRSTFSYNSATQKTDGIFAIYSNLSLSEITFLSHAQSSLDDPSLSLKTGSFLYISANTILTIYNCSFTNGYALYGGAIYILGEADVTITNVVFQSNTGSLGGAIYASSFTSILVSNCQFLQNECTSYSCNIFATYSTTGLTIESSSFYTQSSNSIYAKETSITITGSSFIDTDTTNYLTGDYQYPGGLYLEEIKQVYITDSVFTNLKGATGGAISITVSQTLQQQYGSSLVYSFNGVQITNCFATTNGGAMYLDDIGLMTVSNSNFSGNTAMQNGGGIYLDCDANTFIKCTLELGTQTYIEKNVAYLDGGGIFWNYQEPLNGIVINNQATVYGKNYAGVALAVLMSDINGAYGVFNTSKQILMDDVRSGSTMDNYYFALVDKYGQLMSADNSSKIAFSVSSYSSSVSRILQTSSNSSNVTVYPTTISGTSTYYARQGIFDVSGLIVTGEPNSTVTIQLSCSDIDFTIPSNAAYYAAQIAAGLKEYTINITVNLLSCVIGDGMLDSGSCYVCPDGFYSLYAPTQPTGCTQCNTLKAICNGGFEIGPKPGYWRKNNITEDFLNCPIPANCLGMLPPNYSPIGECGAAYLGPLCATCMPGYTRKNSYECEACPDKVWNLAKVCLILVAMIVMVSLMVRSTLRSAQQTKLHSVYLKIFMNHLQLMVLISSLNFNWPNNIEALLSAPGPIASSFDQVVSIDCFLDTRNASTINRYQINVPDNEWQTVFYKIVIFAVLPLLGGGIIALFWVIYLAQQKRLEQFSPFFMSTNVIVFFLIQPTVTQYMMSAFNCPTYDGDKRLLTDLQVICYEGLHFKIAYYCALPGFIIWSVGIPTYAIIILNKYKEKFDSLDTKQKFGFLYNGYKRSSFFWESIIMYRKVALIFISVVVKSWGVVVQALMTFVVLVFYLQLHNTRRPFITRGLNDVETASILTAIITVYCGIFFITAKSKSDPDFDPNQDFAISSLASTLLFVIILLSNAAFAILWSLRFYNIIKLTFRTRYPTLYTYMCLCGRKDKLEKESSKLAQEAKREEILESIEGVQICKSSLLLTHLVFKEMKSLYTKNKAFYGHDTFMQILSFVEQNRQGLDVTEKKHATSREGKLMKERKMNRTNQIQDDLGVLQIDPEFRDVNHDDSEETLKKPNKDLSKYRGNIYELAKAQSMFSNEDFKIDNNSQTKLDINNENSFQSSKQGIPIYNEKFLATYTRYKNKNNFNQSRQQTKTPLEEEDQSFESHDLDKNSIKSPLSSIFKKRVEILDSPSRSNQHRPVFPGVSQLQFFGSPIRASDGKIHNFDDTVISNSEFLQSMKKAEEMLQQETARKIEAKSRVMVERPLIYRKSVTQNSFLTKRPQSILKNRNELLDISEKSPSLKNIQEDSRSGYGGNNDSDKPFDIRIQKIIKETNADLEEGYSMVDSEDSKRGSNVNINYKEGNRLFQNVLDERKLETPSSEESMYDEMIRSLDQPQLETINGTNQIVSKDEHYRHQKGGVHQVNDSEGASNRNLEIKSPQKLLKIAFDYQIQKEFELAEQRQIKENKATEVKEDFKYLQDGNFEYAQRNFTSALQNETTHEKKLVQVVDRKKKKRSPNSRRNRSRSPKKADRDRKNYLDKQINRQKLRKQSTQRMVKLVEGDMIIQEGEQSIDNKEIEIDLFESIFR